MALSLETFELPYLLILLGSQTWAMLTTAQVARPPLRRPTVPRVAAPRPSPAAPTPVPWATGETMAGRSAGRADGARTSRPARPAGAGP